MNLILSCVLVMLLTICVIFALMHKSMNEGVAGNKMSAGIVHSFVPDNIAPELTKMIEYHKENGIVKYEI